MRRRPPPGAGLLLYGPAIGLITWALIIWMVWR